MISRARLSGTVLALQIAIITGLLSLSSFCCKAESIALDGDMTDWPAGMFAVATPYHVDLRLDLTGLQSLGRGGDLVRIAIDTDGDGATGRLIGQEHGADLVITLNDPDADPDARGLSIMTADGTALDAALLSPNHQPTHAAASFELRLDRSAAIAAHLPPGGWATSGEIDITITGIDDQTGSPLVVRHTRIKLPPLIEHPPAATVDIPGKTEGSLRLLAYNVLWSSPTKPEPGPEPFVRIFRALDPDILLLQEWYDSDQERGLSARERERRIIQWFNRHLPGEEPWTAIGSQANGVFVVSRFPILDRAPDELRVIEGRSRWDFPVRLAAGVLDTPLGPVVIGSTHLKCCGAYDTEEDTRRFEEAELINQTLASLADRRGDRLPVILGGDYNHNGDPNVLATLVASLDTDRSPLLDPLPRVLGTTDTYTHGTPQRSHRRNRLDYITPADASLRISNPFILDTTRLSPASLLDLDLRPDDIEASDHLPVVMDVSLR